MKVFVYGTLRHGQVAHALLGNAALVACVWTDPEFTLLDMGEYPALLEGGRTPVRGEIYDIEPALLAALDEYEDCPRLYRRVQRMVAGHEVMLYVLPKERALGRPALAHGDWCAPGSSDPAG